jgi:hypothetical protein
MLVDVPSAALSAIAPSVLQDHLRPFVSVVQHVMLLVIGDEIGHTFAYRVVEVGHLLSKTSEM